VAQVYGTRVIEQRCVFHKLRNTIVRAIVAVSPPGCRILNGVRLALSTERGRSEASFVARLLRVKRRSLHWITRNSHAKETAGAPRYHQASVANSFLLEQREGCPEYRATHFVAGSEQGLPRRMHTSNDLTTTSRSHP